MAVGQKIVVPAFTDPTIPKKFQDPMISTGTLLLVDFAHSLTAAPATGAVPTTGSKITNLAAPQCAAVLTGVTDLTTLNPTYTQVGMTGTAGKVERSGKGGLHIISSKVNMVAGNGVGIEIPDPIKTWLIAHPAALVVATVCRLITRAATPATGGLIRHLTIANNVGIASRYLIQMLTTDTAVTSYPPTSQSTYAGATRTTPAYGSTGPEIIDQAASGWVGALPTLSTFRGGLYFGDYPDATPALQQKMSSSVVYRIGLEVLSAPSGTPSGYAGFTGRTFGDYTAASSAWYTKNVLTVGGRFYGDTYTDPATIA